MGRLPQVGKRQLREIAPREAHDMMLRENTFKKKKHAVLASPQTVRRIEDATFRSLYVSGQREML